MPKTDEQIIAERNAHIDTLTEEDKARYLRSEWEQDVEICTNLSRELEATIEPIQGDIHHIKVNGQILGYNGFAQWKARRQLELQQRKNRPPTIGFFAR